MSSRATDSSASDTKLEGSADLLRVNALISPRYLTSDSCYCIEPMIAEEGYTGIVAIMLDRVQSTGGLRSTDANTAKTHGHDRTYTSDNQDISVPILQP